MAIFLTDSLIFRNWQFAVEFDVLVYLRLRLPLQCLSNKNTFFNLLLTGEHSLQQLSCKTGLELADCTLKAKQLVFHFIINSIKLFYYPNFIVHGYSEILGNCKSEALERAFTLVLISWDWERVGAPVFPCIAGSIYVAWAQ